MRKATIFSRGYVSTREVGAWGFRVLQGCSRVLQGFIPCLFGRGCWARRLVLQGLPKGTIRKDL